MCENPRFHKVNWPFDPKVVVRVLKEKGYLQVDSAGKSSISKKMPGMGIQRVYAIKMGPMQADEEVDPQ